ncbi:hypothetical protein H072_1807 [Dactylellina haptotyla CBS 200.50]|uniref:F-box domain-containing protein n=1 Tax=Dactylellina haptotyla (strain CBS 200.50) TaxID=1284197 RepID=S8AT50_DACHA|nr:hypothetical protein H072_1807 [Dactylellina haptotyla CBS 200.50]
MTISRLPVEIQEQIFTHLDWTDHFRCTLVCKLWRSIILSNTQIKDSWYTRCSDEAIDSSLHNIFTTPGVECVCEYTPPSGDLDFEVLLPATSSGRRGRVNINQKSALLQENIFRAPSTDQKSEPQYFYLYLLGIPLCGDQLIKVPWEGVEGAIVGEGAPRVSISSFLNWLLKVVTQEPDLDVSVEEGVGPRVKLVLHFSCNQYLPWILDLRIGPSG